eukprot:363309-Chlamydomonas_euryale.AAC.30
MSCSAGCAGGAAAVVVVVVAAAEMGCAWDVELRLAVRMERILDVHMQCIYGRRATACEHAAHMQLCDGVEAPSTQQSDGVDGRAHQARNSQTG